MAVTAWKLCRRAAGGWTNQNNILADDGAVASQNVGAGSQTAILVGDDFGFSDADIPSGATIDGIEVRIEASKWPYAMSAALASLRKSLGTNVGDNKSASITLTNSLTKFTLGGASDKWGTTWTDTEVKQASFGFAYRTQNNDGKYSVDANVDCIEVRVYYTSAATTTTTSATTTTTVATTTTTAATTTTTAATTTTTSATTTTTAKGSSGPRTSFGSRSFGGNRFGFGG